MGWYSEVARDVNKIPHPFIEDTMETLKDLSPKEKSKIYFRKKFCLF